MYHNSADCAKLDQLEIGGITLATSIGKIMNAKHRNKPTVYLDHNILDHFVKNGLQSFGNALMDKFQVVYSNETLKEIKRSTGYEDKFLTVLCKLDANYLEQIIEKPSFSTTDKAHILQLDPFEKYAEYCQAYNDEDGVVDAMQQWLYKIIGGRVGDSIADVHNEQIAAFASLLDSVIIDSDEFTPEAKKQMEVAVRVSKAEYAEMLTKIEHMIKNEIADDNKMNAIKDFRNHCGIGPKELCNIKEPNVLTQIWEKFSTVPPYNQNTSSIEEFLQLKENPIFPAQPYYTHQKITRIYWLLNMLGYYPDSNVQKERRFVAAISDTSHASLASYCDLLLSNDENFIKKAHATYKYLRIATEAMHITINKIRQA